MPRPKCGTPKEIIYCPKCRSTMTFDRTEYGPISLSGHIITWNIYKCPECKFESFRRKY